MCGSLLGGSSAVGSAHAAWPAWRGLLFLPNFTKRYSSDCSHTPPWDCTYAACVVLNMASCMRSCITRAAAGHLAPAGVRTMASTPRNKTLLRSQEWFDNPDNPGMTALYLERYLNYGLTREELQSGRPIIGIAQTGSDLSPCNRIHVDLMPRVRDGIRDAGGIPFEFPCHPIQETGKRPTAALDRNLTYMALVEVGRMRVLARGGTRRRAAAHAASSSPAGAGTAPPL